MPHLDRQTYKGRLQKKKTAYFMTSGKKVEGQDQNQISEKNLNLDKVLGG